MESWLETTIIIVSIYVGLCIIVYFIQTFFFFHPEKLPESFEFVSKYHIPMHEVFITAADGSKINALHYTIVDPKGVVFYFKGNTRSIKGWGNFSKDFVSKNYDFFMIDYPGFGKSKGLRSEQTIYKNAQHAYEWLCERYTENQIVIYGRSMGSGFAAKIASINNPKMFIMDSGFYSFFHLAQRYMPILPMRWLIKYKIPTYKFIRSINCPVFFIHGNLDRVIPYKYSIWLQKLIPENSKLYSISGGHHNDLPKIAQYHTVLYEILNDDDLYIKFNQRFI